MNKPNKNTTKSTIKALRKQLRSNDPIVREIAKQKLNEVKK